MIMRFAIKRIRAFIDYASNDKLWYFATACFAALFWWLVSFANALPSVVAEIYGNSERFQANFEEGDKAGTVTTALRDGVAAFVAATEFYQQHVGGRPKSEVIEPQILGIGVETVGDAQSKLAFAVGAIQGVRFKQAALEDYRIAFQADLEGLSDIVSKIQKFLLLNGLDQRSKAFEEISGIDQATLDRIGSAMLIRVQQFTNEVVRFQRAQQLDILEQTAKMRLFQLKL
jgi:hypothetical protein